MPSFQSLTAIPIWTASNEHERCHPKETKLSPTELLDAAARDGLTITLDGANLKLIGDMAIRAKWRNDRLEN